MPLSGFAGSHSLLEAEVVVTRPPGLRRRIPVEDCNARVRHSLPTKQIIDSRRYGPRPRGHQSIELRSASFWCTRPTRKQIEAVTGVAADASRYNKLKPLQPKPTVCLRPFRPWVSRLNPSWSSHQPARPRRLRVSLFVPRADEPASTPAHVDFTNILKMRHFLDPSRFE